MTETLIDKAIYIAPCQQENPIELYVNQAGYEWICKRHNRQAIYKVLFLSPKGEVEGDFGPKYFCEVVSCLPNIHTVASSQDAYLDVFYGKFNQT